MFREKKKMFIKNTLTTSNLAIDSALKIEKVWGTPDHSKYFMTSDINKFSNQIFKAKLKEAKLSTNNDLATVEECAIGSKEKAEKIETFHFSYILGKKGFSGDWFQCMSVYQPTPSTIDYK